MNHCIAATLCVSLALPVGANPPASELAGTWSTEPPTSEDDVRELELSFTPDAIYFRRDHWIRPAALILCNAKGTFEAKLLSITDQDVAFSVNVTAGPLPCPNMKVQCSRLAPNKLLCSWFRPRQFLLVRAQP
jgi:hypothetical protein